MHVHPSRTYFWLLAWALLLILGTPAVGDAAPFPRGPGLYFDPFKLGALVVAFLAWIKLCAWVDVDANNHRIAPVFWNSLLLGAGLLGFFVLWNLPAFWPLFILACAGVCGGAYWYVTKRNRRAAVEEQLLNRAHFRRLYEHYVGTRLQKKDKEAQEDAQRSLPIHFMSRSTTGENTDTDRVERVQQSKGYKAALEMVWDALQKRATDIHLEPTKNEMMVRFRIDGMMTNFPPFSRAVGDSIVSIFKVISNIDITEKRKAQDGSFSAQVEDRLVEFRVATAGSVVGEKLVMRVLDSSAQLADLGQVGMVDELQARIRDDIISKPHGLFLVCGPTGSGKSTTLYACLHEIDRFSQNVITVENPVEYRLDGITQIEVNPKAGKTFASELRSILRQDPDVILIGEIRDKETAEIACQAAQTGHLVFSTVHANDSVAAVARLIDLGVSPSMLADALLAILAQRLVRKLCKKCRKRMKPSAETFKRLKLDPDEVRYIYRANEVAEDKKDDDDDVDEKKAKAEKPELCKKCGGVGYFKRTGVFELLVLNDKVRELIGVNPNVHEIRRVAVAAGLKSLFEDGSRLVVEGETSIQELLRVAK